MKHYVLAGLAAAIGLMCLSLATGAILQGWPDGAAFRWVSVVSLAGIGVVAVRLAIGILRHHRAPD